MKKAERVNRVESRIQSEEELLRLLPEIDYIESDELRRRVVDMFIDGCPDSFWSRPSSSTGKYHPQDETGEYGNLIHTKRVYALFEDLSFGWMKIGRITEEERDIGRAAALLHDTYKYSWPSEGRDHTTDEHDVIAAEASRYIGRLPEPVVMAIHSHMGFWGEGKQPESDLELLLHTCDMVASRRSNEVSVLNPSEEILEEWPDIRTVDSL